MLTPISTVPQPRGDNDTYSMGCLATKPAISLQHSFDVLQVTVWFLCDTSTNGTSVLRQKYGVRYSFLVLAARCDRALQALVAECGDLHNLLPVKGLVLQTQPANPLPTPHSPSRNP